ncbi:MAG: DUF4249 family protein [Bacteroidota bacterium]
MKVRLFSISLILFFAACVDRINFDVGAGASPVVVNGYISDQPGPYRVEILKAIEIDSKLSIKSRISVKRVMISDNTGYSEDLTQIIQGVYETAPNGIRGQVGRSYQLLVEFLDGRIYETKPDTLMPPGQMDSIYFNFKSEKLAEETKYGFDIFFNSHAGTSDSYRFLWKFIGTYQIETNPELYSVPCGESRCPQPLPCSGYVLGRAGELIKNGPCECCTCWVSLADDMPVISDNQFVQSGQFNGVKAGYVPLDSWVFQNKVHAEVRQQSLSPQAFNFWKAIQAQKAANSSLFQPITGRIPSNFVQIGGPTGQIEGLFYATAITSRSVFITRDDVPNQNLLTDPSLKFPDNCAKFGNATSQRPSFWE